MIAFMKEDYMSLRTDLDQKMKDAMRAHEDLKKNVYRMALASVKFIEKENGKTLEDNEVMQVLQKEIKIRRETLADAVKGNRTETIDELQKEIKVLEDLLPAQLSEDELKEIIAKAIQETGAETQKDMGKVMKTVLPQVKGKAENAVVSKMIKEALS